MHVYRPNQYQQKGLGPKQSLLGNGSLLQTHKGKKIHIRWAIFISRKEMRLILIVDYQINSVWIN